MFSWILDEAEAHSDDACAVSSVQTCRVYDSDHTISTTDTGADSSTNYSGSSRESCTTASTSKGSATSEETNRLKLHQQARMLTQRILTRERKILQQNYDYDADESTVDTFDAASGTGSYGAGASGAETSGVATSASGSYYFATLNDMINRSRSLIDEDDQSKRSPAYETRAHELYDVSDLEAGGKRKKEKRKRKKIRNNKKKEHGDLKKGNGGRKFIIFSLVITLSLVIALSGLAVYLIFFKTGDSPSNSRGNSGITDDPENPVIRINDLLDDQHSSAENIQGSLTTNGKPEEEDIVDNSMEVEQESSSTTIAVKEEENIVDNSTGNEQPSSATSPPVQDEVADENSTENEEPSSSNSSLSEDEVADENSTENEEPSSSNSSLSEDKNANDNSTEEEQLSSANSNLSEDENTNNDSIENEETSSATSNLFEDEEFDSNSKEGQEEEDVIVNTQDSAAVPSIDEDLLTSHMEAYEQWKRENGFSDEDHDSSDTSNNEELLTSHLDAYEQWEHENGFLDDDNDFSSNPLNVDIELVAGIEFGANDDFFKANDGK